MLSRAVANREVRWQELTLLAVHFWVKGLRKDLAAFEKGKTCGESATDVGKSAMDVGKSGIIGKCGSAVAQQQNRLGLWESCRGFLLGKDRRKKWGRL